MRPYRKNYAPKSRAEVAGANDHLWIPKVVRETAEDREKYRRNYERIFKHK